MATNSEIWEGNGFEVVVPTSDDQEIAYPVPTDSLQPNIPAHMELTAQAVANSVNTISKKVDDLRGGDDDVYKEKVNVPDDNSSIEKTYGKNKQGLAAQGNGTNSTYWEDFAVLNEQGANSHKYYIKGDGTYGEISDLAKQEDMEEAEGNIETLLKHMLPIGTIMMWSNASIPAGWAECNGQTKNGIKTQDMRGMVPVGANPGNVGHGDHVILNEEVGHSKGEFRLVTNQTPRHTVGGAIYDHPSSGSTHYVTATNASNWHGHHIPVRAQHTGGTSRPTAWMYDNNRSSSGASDGSAGAVNHSHVGYFRGWGQWNPTHNVNVNQRGRGVYFIMYVGGN